MMQETVSNYQTLLENIPELINISGYRNDFVARKLGIKPTTFSIKKQRGNWTPEEVAKLLSIIENEETEDYYLGIVMQGLESDETLTLSEFKREAGWK